MAHRILVIEDEPSIADNITYALSTDGFEPEWRPTGKEGLEVLEAGGIDLIILDVGLPDQSGFELAKKIRESFDVPIIFVTARADEVDRIVGLEIGADDYVVKPFSPRELSARVRAVLRRTAKGRTSPEEKPKQLKVGAFEVDEEKHKIFYHGAVVDLSRYEFRILEILIASPGRVYSRAHLMQLAWEEPDMSLERTVDTHVKTIRRKLKTISEDTDPIITHRGVGYSLREEE